MAGASVVTQTVVVRPRNRHAFGSRAGVDEAVADPLEGAMIDPNAVRAGQADRIAGLDHRRIHVENGQISQDHVVARAEVEGTRHASSAPRPSPTMVLFEPTCMRRSLRGRFTSGTAQVVLEQHRVQRSCSSRCTASGTWVAERCPLRSGVNRASPREQNDGRIVVAFERGR